MKRILPLAIAVTLTLALTSCEKRDYTCTCKMTHGPDQSFELGRMSNDAAQKACNDQQVSMTQMSTGIVSFCKVTY